MDRFQHKKTEEKINLSGPIFAQKGNSPRSCSKQDTKEPYMWSWGSSKSGDNFHWVRQIWGSFLENGYKGSFSRQVPENVVPFIVGGVESEKNQWPWMAALFIDDAWYILHKVVFLFFFFLIFLTSGFLCQVLRRFSDIRKLCPDSSTLCWCSYNIITSTVLLPCYRERPTLTSCLERTM